MVAPRESHWLVIRRCLAIIRRLQRGPAPFEKLVAAVKNQIGADTYGRASGASMTKRFHNDIARIRSQLGINVRFDRKNNLYMLGAPGETALLDLPDEALSAIAFLAETFDAEAPLYNKIGSLLDALTNYLSDSRRRELARRRSQLRVDLHRKDADVIDPEVQQLLEQACAERRQVEFHYRSPSQQDEVPRLHLVEPYELMFDTVRRHYYLRGFCLHTDGPLGKRVQERIFYYRLGRVIPGSVCLLPTKMPLVPRRAPRYLVRYELAPEIARLGVSQYFDEMVVEQRSDGSALVQGYADDMFWATRTLLHYGPGCRVLGGSEILREMRRLVEAMAKVYNIAPTK